MPSQDEKSETGRLGDAFWRFSVTVYQRPGVPEACLRLQDVHGWDVNLALFSLWCGLTRGALEPVSVAAAVGASAAWSARAVRPLRHLRRELKTGAPEIGAAAAVGAFRERLKALELEAERVEQAALVRFAAAAAGPAGAAAARRVFEAARAGPADPDESAAFETLIAAGESVIRDNPGLAS